MEPKGWGVRLDISDASQNLLGLGVTVHSWSSSPSLSPPVAGWVPAIMEAEPFWQTATLLH